MGALDGGIKATFGQVFGAIYLPATLTDVTLTPNGKGGFTRSTVAVSCRAQKDNADKTMRETPGFVETDAKIIVLQASMTTIPTTDDEITVRGELYSVFRIRRDPADSHWIIHGKRKL